MIPLVGVVIVTTKCNFACEHCSVRGSPYGKYTITRELIGKFIDELSSIPSVKLVAFSGGEPTLYLDELLYGIEYAHKKGFITRLVTNAWWARTYEEANKLIGVFKAHGLDEINVSYDDFHAKFIKVDNVANLVKAALENSLRVAIGVICLLDSYYTADNIKKILSEKIGIPITELEKRVVFIEDQPTPVGGASDIYVTKTDKFVHNDIKCELGCVNIGRVLALLPNGDVKVCCGHAVFQQENDPFLLGNIMNERLINMVRKAQQTLFYWWLHLRGPKKILEKIGVREQYVNLCHACEVIIKKYARQVYEYMLKHKYEILINDILLSDNITRLEKVLRKLGLFEKLWARYVK